MSELPALRAYWSKHRSLGRPTPDVGWEELDVLLTAIDALADALRQERHDLRWTLIALPGNNWPQYRIDDVYPAMPHVVRAYRGDQS